MMTPIAREHALLFEPLVPNEETIAAMRVGFACRHAPTPQARPVVGTKPNADSL